MGHTNGGSTAVGSALWTWQQDALDAWRAAGSRGIVQAVTGTGKTRVGVEAIRETLAVGRQVLVLVPTTALLRQWARTLSRDLTGARIGLLGDGKVASFRSCDVLIATVQSASRRQFRPLSAGGLLIADECHRYGAPSFGAALLDHFDARLGLTATLERGDDGVATVLTPYFGEVVHDYGFAAARADDVIAPFRVALIGVDLPAPERETYEEARERATAARTQLIRRYSVPSSPFGEFLSQVNQLAKGSFAAPSTRTARRYLSAFHTYREILATTRAKLEVVPLLAPAVAEAGGTLVFGESVAASELMAADLRDEGLDVSALHSQLSTSEREQLLSHFGSGLLHGLVAPRVLDEGIDVPEADLAVIVAASQSRRQMVQRLGRVVRRKQDGRVARLVIMYVRGTTEDPADGGHEAFLDLVLDVADERQTFGIDDIEGLLAFLRGGATEEADGDVEDPEPGWWETWSTNAPELGLEIVEDGPVTPSDTTGPAELDGPGGNEEPWWKRAGAARFGSVQPAARRRGLPEWLELRIARRASDDELARIVSRFQTVRNLTATEEQRLRALPIVQHVAAHPEGVAEALLDLEFERVEAELAGEPAAAVTPTAVRVRQAPSEPHVLSEPHVADLWYQ